MPNAGWKNKKKTYWEGKKVKWEESEKKKKANLDFRSRKKV